MNNNANVSLEEVKFLCISTGEELKAAFDYLDRQSKSTDGEIKRMFAHISEEEFKHAAMNIAKLAKMDNNFAACLYDYMNSDDIVGAEDEHGE